MAASGRVVIVGANGQLGTALRSRLPGAVSLDLPDLDITDRRSLDQHDWSDVATVYNAAAFTAVDLAEKAPAQAWAVNAAGPANLARLARKYGFCLVHLSTEYVFDGTSPVAIAEDAPVAPLNVYGASKAAGEFAADSASRSAIVRTSWLAGEGSNFVKTMLNLARRGVRPTVVDDQIGRPTFAFDLAVALTELVAKISEGAPAGIYHCTGDGDCVSWGDLARRVFEAAGRPGSDITSVTTEKYREGRPMSAARPANSVLDMSKINGLGIRTPRWEDSLLNYLDGIK